ncbi:unnamed protein product, partial [Sphacelaria rigidula]
RWSVSLKSYEGKLHITNRKLIYYGLTRTAAGNCVVWSPRTPKPKSARSSDPSPVQDNTRSRRPPGRGVVVCVDQRAGCHNPIPDPTDTHRLHSSVLTFTNQPLHLHQVR